MDGPSCIERSAQRWEPRSDRTVQSPSDDRGYFPTKEDVVLFDALDPLLIASYRQQPADLTPIQALRGSLHEIFDSMTRAEVEEQLQRGRLVYDIPELQDAMIADLVRTAGLMATLVAERSGLGADDRRIRVYAGAVMGALMGGMIPILQDPKADFVADMDAALDLLEGGLRL